MNFEDGGHGSASHPSPPRAQAGSSAIFRPEASRHREPPLLGEPLRYPVAWIDWTYRVLLLLLAAGLVFSLVGEMTVYSRGPAIVRAEPLAEIVATQAGMVESVEVESGDRVEEGTVLLRLQRNEQEREIERLRSEFERRLVQRLREPSDPTVADALGSLRLQIETAEDTLARRAVAAPVAGWMSRVEVRPGQHVSAGDYLLSISTRDRPTQVIAFLPGEHRPLLEDGMQMMFRPAGERDRTEELTITAVSDSVLGADQAARELGPSDRGKVALEGPLVTVTAPLVGPPRDGRIALHDGMVGTAEVPLRRTRILFFLLPPLGDD